MKQVRSNNSIFSYAFIGALLFVAALAFTFAYLSNIVTLELSYTGIAMILSIASVSLLYKAVRYDRERLREV